MIGGLKRACLIGGLALGLGSSAHAGSSLFRVCFEEWEPYAYIGPDHKIQGISVDILRKAAEGKGWRLDFQAMPYARCVKEVEAGKRDIKLFANPDEMPGLPRVATSTEYWMVAAVVHNSAPLDQYRDIQQFSGFQVGRVNGYEMPEPIASFRDWKEILAPGPEENLKLIHHQRIDATFLDLMWAERKITSLNLKLKVLRPLVVLMPQVSVLAPNRAHEAEQLENEIKSLFRRGDIDRIYRQHTGHDLKSWLKLAGRSDAK
ncbi:substrate-binding periplasmic protein [Parachitinimonas caeni]|uniref:Transporter substrate-binding domain-containing protein n=1 Tax=Parachitinimonas caeni TaxID=3031301 RepID=A0ABT7E3H8_9NEIS|nr:transporter substrate-binding domain-containing protein [Parachitinimonas caeni]MDK2126860.1 transporter substrate-binding domain-containing protein [Parachitinimonas caeni]